MVAHAVLDLAVVYGRTVRDPGFGFITGGYVVRVSLAMPFFQLLMALHGQVDWIVVEEVSCFVLPRAKCGFSLTPYRGIFGLCTPSCCVSSARDTVVIILGFCG